MGKQQKLKILIGSTPALPAPIPEERWRRDDAITEALNAGLSGMADQLIQYGRDLAAKEIEQRGLEALDEHHPGQPLHRFRLDALNWALAIARGETNG